MDGHLGGSNVGADCEYSIQVISLGGKGQYAYVVNDTGAPTSGTDTIPSKITQFPVTDSG
ncbi:hypothetical protein [Streptomyces sp. NPDC057253]|uniref:hypothetical protein n=1 Tax=Streptomyces sp. NPDC057253 TaxID=3346069 RepID=UPI003634F14C